MQKTRFLKLQLQQIILCVILINFLSIDATVLANETDKKYNFCSPKKKERIDMIKKMKLLEVLNLETTKAEKFLLKLSSYDKKIEENRNQHCEVNGKLDAAIKANNVTEMQTLAAQLIELQENFNKTNIDKIKDIKTILSDTEFAKYINFENKFMRDFFDSFMDEKYKNKKHDNEDKKRNSRTKK